jgi:hypothetical protein
MEQDIYETVQNLVSTTKIRHRILSAIRFHHEKHYFFTERTFRFPLTSGRWEYRPDDGFGLPGDLVEILGSFLWLTPVNSTVPVPVERLGRSSMDWDRAAEATAGGEPAAWDWFEGALRLSPTPNDADVLEGPYVRDIGVPQKKYDTAAGTWGFFTPDGTKTLNEDYTSHWFDSRGGYGLIKHRALYLIYNELLRDMEQAQAEQLAWLEEKGRLEDESEGKAGPLEIVPAFW